MGYWEMGDRTPGDQVDYPQDDLQAVLTSVGQWQFLHKDGKPYHSTLTEPKGLLDNGGLLGN
ncbi:MAG: hypothetical protein ACPGVO_18205 [Spirulinaceae cyanobacterium]